jgi:hypothetical protein
MKKAGLSSILIVVVLLAVGAIAKAQQPTKVPRIVFLLGTSPGPDPRVEGFRQGLRELGYVEGKNIAIEWPRATPYSQVSTGKSRDRGQAPEW